MIPGAQFLSSSSRLTLLRAYVVILWLSGFEFAAVFQSALFGSRAWWQWVALLCNVVFTATIGYVLNQRLVWIDRALPAAADAAAK